MQKGNIMPEQEKNSENEVLFHYLWQILYEPEKASLPSGELPASQQLAAGLDMLLRFVLETRCFGDDLVSGHIRDARQPSRDNVLAGPLKAVHSMLQHLIWLMDEVAGGDYEQRLPQGLTAVYPDLPPYGRKQPIYQTARTVKKDGQQLPGRMSGPKEATA